MSGRSRALTSKQPLTLSIDCHRATGSLSQSIGRSKLPRIENRPGWTDCVAGSCVKQIDVILVRSVLLHSKRATTVNIPAIDLLREQASCVEAPAAAVPP